MDIETLSISHAIYMVHILVRVQLVRMVHWIFLQISSTIPSQLVRRQFVMSCYFRHLKDILQEAGIEVTRSNKKEIDRAFHQIVGTIYKDCPTTWRRLKQELADNGQKRQKLVQKLQNAVR